MVKQFHRQTGSVHIVIVTIIVLLILGALGFVFWKNISAKSHTSSTTKTSSTTLKPVSDYLTISDWNIKFKITDELKTTTIIDSKEQSNDTPPLTSYAFTTKRIHALGGACATQPFANTEILTRTSDKPNTTPDGILLNNTAIDGYYYILGAPSASCTAVGSDGKLLNQAQADTKAKSIEDSDSVALKSMIETLQSVKTNDKFLTLSDWNIQFQIPSYLVDITQYNIPTDNDNIKLGIDNTYYEFSTKQVENFGGDCVAPGVDGHVQRLANLIRASHQVDEPYTMNLNQSPINGYFYYLYGEQSVCESGPSNDANAALETQDRASLLDMLKNPIAK